MGPSGLPSYSLGELGKVAVKYVSRLLLPRRIDRYVVIAYIRKAVRVGLWRSLKAESRALLRALSTWRGVIRSKVLVEIVRKILVTIELETLRGRSIFYGVLQALRNGLRDLLSSAELLLCLGVSYISNSPLFRLLG